MFLPVEIRVTIFVPAFSRALGQTRKHGCEDFFLLEGACSPLLQNGFQTAANAKRINAGMDFEPVFLMIEARWFSTVR
jgi:hypothetical protein